MIIDANGISSESTGRILGQTAQVFPEPLDYHYAESEICSDFLDQLGTKLFGTDEWERIKESADVRSSHIYDTHPMRKPKRRRRAIEKAIMKDLLRQKFYNATKDHFNMKIGIIESLSFTIDINEKVGD